MDEKKLKLIETSLKLFSKKGFHATSIQEIAEQSHISKGAFYLHFQSKDELLEEIFRYYAENVLDKLLQSTNPDKPAKEQLVEQVTSFFDMFQDHYEFIVMLFHDNLQLGFKKTDFFDDIQRKSFEWTEQHLLNIYGKDVEEYVVDLAIELDGYIGGYIKWIFLHNLPFNSRSIAESIVMKLDLTVKHAIEEKTKPNFSIDQLFGNQPKQNQQQVEVLLQEIEKKINEQPALSEDALQVLEVLKEELGQKVPRPIIISTMIDHLEDYKELKEECRKLRENCLEKRKGTT